jgi:acetyltransferase EpsM
LIVGAGGHARVVADVVRLMGQFTIAGFIDSSHPGRQGEAFDGATILGGLEVLERASAIGVRHVFIAVGDCEARLRLAAVGTAAGLELPVLTHPSSVVAHGTAIGVGTVLAAGAILNPGARLGANVIVNTAASVDHDCEIADGVHIAVGARLAGNVRVGRATWVGMGALVKEGVQIGAGVFVGAGALVLRDVPDGVMVYGSPAAIVRPMNHDDPARV